MNDIEKSIRRAQDMLLTIEEVAKILRVHKRTVTRYIEAGRLKASKLGVWRIKQSDLNAFLEETSNVKPPPMAGFRPKAGKKKK